MPIIVKYNNDLAFRRSVAFRRVYRGKNLKLCAGIEIGVMVLCVVMLVILLGTPGGRNMPVFMLYLSGMIGIYLLVKFIRTILMVKRVTPGTPDKAMREFYFDEMGFTFGPLDVDGTVIETKWQEIDKVYMTDGVIYILAMHKRHWAAVDRRLVVEGNWDELIGLITKNLPKSKVVK